MKATYQAPYRRLQTCLDSAAHLTEVCRTLVQELNNVAGLPQVAIHLSQGVEIVNCPVATKHLMLGQHWPLCSKLHGTNRFTASCLFRSVYSRFHSLRFLASTLA